MVKHRLMHYRILLAKARGAQDAENLPLARSLMLRAEYERDHLMEKLSHIEDHRVRAVMSLRYLHGFDWERVADACHYSQRYVMKLHKRGLEEFR